MSHKYEQSQTRTNKVLSNKKYEDRNGRNEEKESFEEDLRNREARTKTKSESTVKEDLTQVSPSSSIFERKKQEK